MTTQETRHKHLNDLADIHHRGKYGDYEDSYEEFAEVYLGEEHDDIPQYASIAEDETYGMIHLFETLPQALADQADIPSSGETLNVPVGIIDLDTGERIQTHAVVLTRTAFDIVKLLVQNHLAIQGPAADEIRAAFAG